MSAPPALADLEALAERTLERLAGDGQVAIVWERRRTSAVPEQDSGRAIVTAHHDGAAATATSRDLSDVHLGRAAKAAGARARGSRAQAAPALPGPAGGLPHGGYDPGVLDWAPGDGVEWEAALARVAVASSTGLRAAEQRTHVAITARAPAGTAGRTVAVRAAAARGADLDAAAAVAEAERLAAVAGPPHDPAPSGPVVLGPEAVAVVLGHLRAHFGVHLDLGGSPLGGRHGTRVAAAAVGLSDAPRHPLTLPRSYDIEGVPRQDVVLVRDGLLRGRVHDSASAARAGTASTGHATRPSALAPLPEHLVLAGGRAESIDELAEPVAQGLYVPALSPAREADGGAFRHCTSGAAAIAAGAIAGPVADTPVLVDPLAVLTTVQALGRSQRLVLLPGHCPGGAGAAVVPALRAGAGITRAA